MQKKVQKMILQQQMIFEKETILAGISGGADSVCLLLLLAELRKEVNFHLEAVHVEHGIRGEESLSDANFVKDLCGRMKIPCHMISVDVPSYSKEKGIGMEESARILRYEAFVCLAKEKQAKIALAHHMEDNAETIVFQMLRGSSITGLCGMQAMRTDEQGVTYIRPLLTVHRKEIEDFLQLQAQEYCIDSTNAELEYSRNFIRTVVLPNMKEINAQAVAHINHTANELRDIHSFLQEETKKAWISVVEITEDCGKVNFNSSEVELDEKHIVTSSKTDCIDSPIEVGVSTDKMKIESSKENCPSEADKNQNTKEKTLILNIRKLNDFHIAIQKEVAYQAISYMLGGKKDISTVHVQDLLKICQNQSGKELHLPNGLIAKKEYQYLKFFFKNNGEQKKTHSYKTERDSNLFSSDEKVRLEETANLYQEKSDNSISTEMQRIFFQDEKNNKLEISSTLLEEWKNRQQTIELSLGKGKILQIKIFSIENFEKYIACVEGMEGKSSQSTEKEEQEGLLRLGKFSKIPQKRYTKWLDYDKIKDGFCIRTRQSGDAFITDALGHHKKLKQYLIDEKIPATERDHLWLLAQAHTVLWLIGGRISEHIKVTEDTKTIIEFTYKGGK